MIHRMKIKHIRLIFAALCFWPALLQAQEGDNVFTFLRYPSSAHANALGGHTVSLIERDPSLVFHNPALLGGEMDGLFNLNYMNYVADIHTGSAVYTKALRERSAWGVGVTFVSYGSIREVDREQTVLGAFSPADINLSGFYSYDLSDKWRGGVSLKLLYSTLAEYTSFGFAVDAGLSYYDTDNDFSYGIALKNLGAQLQGYDGRRERLPWDIQMGVSKKVGHAPFRYSITAMYLNRWKFSYIDANIKKTELNESFMRTLAKHLIFGVDFVPSDNFWIGVGYNPKMNMDMKLQEGGNGLGGFSIGAGLKVARFDLSASVARYHPSALSLMLSISTALSTPAL